MASAYPSQMLSASTLLQPHSKMAIRTSDFVIPGFTGSSWYNLPYSCIISAKPKRVFQNTRLNNLCAMNMTAGQSDDSRKMSFDLILNRAGQYWDKCPQPVKTFPWNRALENFIQLILDLTLAVIKYLSVPLLAVSSLSEMSYCARERKLFFTPVPLLIGIVFAGILRETALELSPLVKDAEIPWHLIAMAIFFVLVKLPGPYYPYWGRIFLPHFANGGLWGTLWFAFLWYRRPHKVSEASHHSSLENKL